MNLGFAASPSDAPPPVAAPTVTPAGRKKHRKYIEVDGNVFEVESIEHARALFDRIKALAQTQAEKIVEPIIAKNLKQPPKNRPIKVAAPDISTSIDELQGLTLKLRDEIRSIYRQASIDAEIRLRLQLQQIEDDDEDMLMLL